MPFNHLSGTTTKGAADPIADFFTTLEDFLSNTVGWTVAAGAGTTNLRLSSAGEAGAGYTMLFVHIWQVGDTIRAEVSDDVIPTHETAEGGVLDIDGLGEFQFWISADLDAIVMVIPYRGTHRPLYVGIVEPLAITPVDETYHMVSAGPLLSNASILRQHTGIWDVDITNYTFSGLVPSIRRSMKSAGSYHMMPLYAGRQNAIAGQYKFIGYRLGDASAAPGDILPSTTWGGTATWMVMYNGAQKFALQISGAPPGDIPQKAGFGVSTGISANQLIWIGTDLVTFMTGLGWTDLGDPGAPQAVNRLFHSTGESGTRNIYVLIAASGGFGTHIYVQDDAAGSHRTSNLYSPIVPAEYPLTWWAAGDLDGVSFMYHAPSLDRYSFQSAGMCHMDSPNIAGDEYNMYAWVDRPAAWNYTLRRRGDDFWSGGQLYHHVNGAGNLTNSNANLFDLATYCLWPIQLSDRGTSPALTLETWGTLPYIFWTDGGGIANLDTITIGGDVWTLGNTGGALGFLALRTT